MSEPDLVEIETFPDRGLAEMLAVAIEAEGIPYVIQADDGGGLHGALGMVSGARLLVPSAQADRAREILAAMRTEPEPE